MAVNITADGDGGGDFNDVGLLAEDLFGLLAEFLDGVLLDALASL